MLCWQFTDQWIKVINESAKRISTGHTITDKKVSFFIYGTTRYTWKTLGISIMIILNSQVVKKSYNWKIHAPNWSISLLPIPQRINFSPDMTLHRTMNRTVCESSFSENIMLNFPENAKEHSPKNDTNCPKFKTRLIFPFFFPLFFSCFLETRIFPDT